MTVFINNEFVPEEKALLHVSDLAIQRGYGVFDFFKVVNSVPVFLQEHLDRFYFSAEQMHLNVAYSKDELKKIISALIEKNNAANTGVRITLTGGYSPDGYQLFKPNLVIALRPLTPPTEDQFQNGIKLLTYQHQRQLPQAKTIDYLMAIWLQPFIKENAADDVLYHQNGWVSECPRSNFFIVTHENKIITPSKNILKGVMRSKLIEVTKTSFEIEERALSVDEIKNAKEAFISSTTKMLIPVHQIDECIFSKDHSITTQVFQSLLQLQNSYVQSA
ncbi:MAG: aminotransferase class IV [Flavisolibacter sp.]|nr:aminotransferase class IV [Flavisolibacter sp.]